jgi:Tfp pilus assembly protein PilZ
VEPVQLAKMARESLASALNAIQSCDDAPDELFDVAEPIAQTITILRKIERGGGTMLDGRDIALKNVRKVLSDVQNIDTSHPATDEVLEAVAASLAKVNALARWKGGAQASVPPPAEAPAPKPAPAPAAAPRPEPAPVAAPRPEPVHAPAPVAAKPEPAPAPAPAPTPAPRPAAPAPHYDEPRHVLDARPKSAPPPPLVAQPVVHAKPAPQPAPAPAPAPQPVVHAKPAPQPAPAPAPVPPPVVHAKPAPQPAPAPAPAPQPVVHAKPAPQPAPAPPPVVHAKPIEPKPEPAPAPVLAPVFQAKPVEEKPAPAPAPAPEPKAAPKKVPAPAAPPGVRTLDVSLGTRSVSNFYRGLGGNDVIEHGGVFVETYGIPKIGMQVQLHVHMPGDYEFYALATVMWTREPGGSSEPGFGARFTEIGNDGRQLVYRYSRIREPMFYDDL